MGEGYGRGAAVGRGLGVGVGLTVGVGLGVGVGQGVPWPRHPVILRVSMRQPSLEPLVSLAIRQRTLPEARKGSDIPTPVVMKPSELPLQARRPASGLPRSVLIVRL